MSKVHDYAALEKEYINSTISIRELCRRHDIRAFSTVAEYAKHHGWNERRERIQSSVHERVEEKVAERLAETEADELLEYRDMALSVIKGALIKFAQQLENPEFVIEPQDTLKLINQGLLILGQPTSRTEERRLELSGSLGTLQGLPEDFLRRLAEATRPRAPLGLGPGEAPQPGPGGSRQN